jgi:hypothetical protein
MHCKKCERNLMDIYTTNQEQEKLIQEEFCSSLCKSGYTCYQCRKNLDQKPSFFSKPIPVIRDGNCLFCSPGCESAYQPSGHSPVTPPFTPPRAHYGQHSPSSHYHLASISPARYVPVSKAGKCHYCTEANVNPNNNFGGQFFCSRMCLSTYIALNPKKH